MADIRNFTVHAGGRQHGDGGGTTMDQLEPRVRAIELSVATLTEKSTTFATKEDLAKLETTFERSLKEQSRWTAIAIIGGMSLLSAIVFGIARYLAAAPPV